MNEATLTMQDTLTSEARSQLMARVRGRDTGPELHVRRALWTDGFRYRLHVRDLPGTPDLVLSKYRLAVFVSRMLLAPARLQEIQAPSFQSGVLELEIRCQHQPGREEPNEGLRTEDGR